MSSVISSSVANTVLILPFPPWFSHGVHGCTGLKRVMTAIPVTILPLQNYKVMGVQVWRAAWVMCEQSVSRSWLCMKHCMESCPQNWDTPLLQGRMVAKNTNVVLGCVENTIFKTRTTRELQAGFIYPKADAYIWVSCLDCYSRQRKAGTFRVWCTPF